MEDQKCVEENNFGYTITTDTGRAVEPLSGGDLVKIIKECSSAEVKLFRVGELEIHFGAVCVAVEEPQAISLEEVKEQVQDPSEEDHYDLYMSQVAIDNPREWEERQLNPEKFEE